MENPVYKVSIPLPDGTSRDFEVRDLRPSDHEEHGKNDLLQTCVDEAIAQLGIAKYPRSFYEYAMQIPERMKPMSKAQYWINVLGDAKGVRNYVKRHGQSTFSRYERFYESLKLLHDKQLMKFKGNVAVGKQSWSRIEMMELMKDLLKGVPSPKILEAGSGSGLNLYMVANFLENATVHGFEYTDARVASALVNLVYEDYTNNIDLGDVMNMKYEDGEFDLVYSHHVLEQLGQEGARNAMQEMWRVCKTGLVLQEPTIVDTTYLERWRVKKLGYCQNLYEIAKDLPNCEIKYFGEDKIRSFPNTSHTLVLLKK